MRISMAPRLFPVVLFLLLLLMVAAVHSAEYDMGLDDNLITNPGFETADAKNSGQPAGWGFFKRSVPEGGVYWVDGAVKSGKKLVKLEALEYTPIASGAVGGLTLSSDRFTAPAAQSTVKVSVWLKAQDVKKGSGGYHKLRFTVYTWDEKGDKIRHWDLVCTEGTFDWKKCEGEVVVPEGTKWMSVNVGLTGCTGTAWVDDVTVKVAGTPVDKVGIMKKASALSGPIIIPHPWKMNDGKEKIKLSELSVAVPNGDGIFKDALITWLKKNDISYHLVEQSGAADAGGGLLLAGDSKSKPISARCASSYPGVSWQELGEEGYFLSVSSKDGKPAICIGANSEQGRFYALQTLKQLLVKERGQLLLAGADILDKPVFARRGMAMGAQWFSSRDTAIERLAELKCNYIWNQGSFMGSIFCSDKWRQPLNEGDKRALAAYLENCRKNFITPAISIAPRGNPPTQYSSNTDIDLVVSKINDLYEIGFRNFGLNFDDLQNHGQERLIVQADIEKFDNEMGKAHLYFVNQLYSRLKAKHPDINFSIVPMVYGGFINLPEESKDYNKKSYLRMISALPQEITFISCPYGIENINEVTKLTKRLPLIWDNYFCAWGNANPPVFVPPFRWTAGLNGTSVTGYIFLPNMSSYEDAAGTSWLTAADFFWGSDRQSQERSYQAAVVRAAGGVENLEVLSDYTDFVSRFNDYAIPGKNREDQMQYVQDSIAKLQQWQKKIVPAVPGNLSKAIDKEISGHLSNLELIEKDLSEKPFPVKVRKVNSAIRIDGMPDESAWKDADSMTGFMLFDGKPAEQQTSFRLLYDDRNLYINATCAEPLPERMSAKIKERDRNVFTDDCVEVFLAPETGGKYYHIAVNVTGIVYDALVQDKSWNGSYQASARKGADTWTLEMAVPFSTLGVGGVKPGTRWNFNICRERYAGSRPEVSSYALLLKTGFHSPSRFRVLEFR